MRLEHQVPADAQSLTLRATKPAKPAPAKNLSHTCPARRIIPPMDFALQPHLYRNVPVIFWPWVFWQLLQIMRWADWFGHDVMIAVAATGHVYVTRVSDGPEAPRAFSPSTPTLSPWTRMAIPCRTVQAWLTRAGCNQPKPIAPPTPLPAINDSS